MRQDVRKQGKKPFSLEKGSSQHGWINRLKGWFDLGKALLTTNAIATNAGGRLIGGDGAATGAVHSGMPQRLGETKSRPTRKEAKMSTGARQSLRVHIRWMIRRDMAEVLDIERESFEFPWYEEDFIRCLRQRNCIGMVAEHGERVVGFMIYELHKTRLHILNFAVAKSLRHRDVGRQMAEKLISKLSSQRRTEISLEVRETNLPAQLFFKKLGFRATAVMRSYYEDSPEDAYLMKHYYKPDCQGEIFPIRTNRINRLAG